LRIAAAAPAAAELPKIPTRGVPGRQQSPSVAVSVGGILVEESRKKSHGKKTNASALYSWDSW